MSDSPLIFAACGLRVPVDEHSVDAALEALAARGIDDEELSRLITAAPAWPHPLSDDLRGIVSAAQLAAQLRELRARVVAASTQRPAARPLTGREQALADDVPPHFGNL